MRYLQNHKTKTPSGVSWLAQGSQDTVKNNWHNPWLCVCGVYLLIPYSDGTTSEGAVEGEYQWSAIDEFRLHRRRPSSPSTTITTLTNPTSPSSPTPGNRHHLIDCSRLLGTETNRKIIFHSAVLFCREDRPDGVVDRSISSWGSNPTPSQQIPLYLDALKPHVILGATLNLDGYTRGQRLGFWWKTVLWIQF